MFWTRSDGLGRKVSGFCVHAFPGAWAALALPGRGQGAEEPWERGGWLPGSASILPGRNPPQGSDLGRTVPQSQRRP